MPQITIWTDKQILAYEHPPKFNSIERKRYFSLPIALSQRVNTFHSLPNKAGFYLMFAYFKATHRFFLPEHFHSKDLEFVANKLGWLFFPFQDNPSEKEINIMRGFYAISTYNRHRKIILAHFGYTAFQVKQHRPLINQILEQELANFQRPSLLLIQTLEGLAQRRIELPSYYTLQTILTIAIRKRNRKLHQQLELILENKYSKILTSLLLKNISTQDQSIEEVSNSTFYRLTYLKKFIRKDNPKSIRINIFIWRIT